MCDNYEYDHDCNCLSNQYNDFILQYIETYFPEIFIFRTNNQFSEYEDQSLTALYNNRGDLSKKMTEHIKNNSYTDHQIIGMAIKVGTTGGYLVMPRNPTTPGGPRNACRMALFSEYSDELRQIAYDACQRQIKTFDNEDKAIVNKRYGSLKIQEMLFKQRNQK
jgi:hypothetical protein